MLLSVKKSSSPFSTITYRKLLNFGVDLLSLPYPGDEFSASLIACNRSLLSSFCLPRNWLSSSLKFSNSLRLRSNPFSISLSASLSVNVHTFLNSLVVGALLKRFSSLGIIVIMVMEATGSVVYSSMAKSVMGTLSSSFYSRSRISRFCSSIIYYLVLCRCLNLSI